MWIYLLKSSAENYLSLYNLPGWSLWQSFAFFLFPYFLNFFIFIILVDFNNTKNTPILPIMKLVHFVFEHIDLLAWGQTHSLTHLVESAPVNLPPLQLAGTKFVASDKWHEQNKGNLVILYKFKFKNKLFEKYKLFKDIKKFRDFFIEPEALEGFPRKFSFFL